MKTKQLGSTDIEVPVICLGTMTWGVQNSEAEAHEQLSYATERGFTFIDTAEIYPIPPSPDVQGRTEEYIGNWLKKRGSREDLVLATKVSPAPMLKTRNVGSNPKLDEKSIRDAVEGSLSRLQTDYIDLYQVHWPLRQNNFFGTRGYEHSEDMDWTPIAETLSAMQKLIDEGKIRHVGVSNESAWGVMEYLRVAEKENLPKIVSIQNQYSLTNRTFEISLSEICIREGISMLPYSALQMGVLSGKYLDGARPDGARFSTSPRNSYRYNPQSEYGQEAIRRYVEIAKDHELDPAAMAYAFAASRDFVTSVIIGASKMEQLEVALGAAELELGQEVLSDIASAYAAYPDITV